jgi:hypothetical protein
MISSRGDLAGKETMPQEAPWLLGRTEKLIERLPAIASFRSSAERRDRPAGSPCWR